MNYFILDNYKVSVFKKAIVLFITVISENLN